VLSKNAVGILEFSSNLIKKNKTSFCHDTTARRLCFAYIEVSCDFYRAAWNADAV